MIVRGNDKNRGEAGRVKILMGMYCKVTVMMCQPIHSSLLMRSGMFCVPERGIGRQVRCISVDCAAGIQETVHDTIIYFHHNVISRPK